MVLTDRVVVFQGTDSTMLYKMNKQHTGNKSYVSSKNEHDSRFGIKHFAGVVFYDTNGIYHNPSLNGPLNVSFDMTSEVKELFFVCSGFLEKNRDAISSNIIKMISASKNKLLHDIFKSELSNNGIKKSANNKVTITPTHSLRVCKHNCSGSSIFLTSFDAGFGQPKRTCFCVITLV